MSLVPAVVYCAALWREEEGEGYLGPFTPQSSPKPSPASCERVHLLVISMVAPSLSRSMCSSASASLFRRVSYSPCSLLFNSSCLLREVDSCWSSDWRRWTSSGEVIPAASTGPVLPTRPDQRLAASGVLLAIVARLAQVADCPKSELYSYVSVCGENEHNFSSAVIGTAQLLQLTTSGST